MVCNWPPKKWLACLSCGVRMWTDAGHRRCPSCQKRLAGKYQRQRHKLVELEWDDVVPEGMYLLKGGDADAEA